MRLNNSVNTSIDELQELNQALSIKQHRRKSVLNVSFFHNTNPNREFKYAVDYYYPPNKKDRKKSQASSMNVKSVQAPETLVKHAENINSLEVADRIFNSCFEKAFELI